ncbi:UDP-N-acetyl-D-galactosamine dehydrogenase [Desulfuromonas versatilis]|uniref:UDP-N-acetyl-D-galactosamine dehydrogenase n=1 Tax=Desulfuromonas versatilis TaxID=2802975 RepID=A0ABM8HWW2_9BACT|nr:nucleotide sugar dehydrogenase [Desulfuromonas versatilis]BCR05264.1 UDP-N-acetyl-D-galactosamine dehydrogenase [Desulfuromonas versatilis]
MVSVEDIKARKARIALVGLGYVGLPLAVAFGRKAEVVGFDISVKKVEELRKGFDATGEMTREELADTRIQYTTDPAQLKEASFIIVTVPTPIDEFRKPDLSPLEKASATIGRNLAKGAIVVYESTVYPGVTEEVCVPILERESGLRCGVDFKVGYSPERINPGDKLHTIDKIVKVVAGQDAETLETVARTYELVVDAGVHRASSIKVAEAAKVIENTQRDLNIALMNELAIIFNRMGIPTMEVLEAAGTKWNFLRFTPGLVGGHCIGVDPYYLTHKAEAIGYNPQVILAGRRINDGMGKYVAEMTVKKLIQSGKAVKGCRILVLGLTFKENIPDIRNSKVVDILAELQEYGVEALVHDPFADAEEARHEYGVELTGLDGIGKVDCVILAVSHEAFKKLDAAWLQEVCANGNGAGVVIDVKSFFDKGAVEGQGMVYWRL